MAIPAATEEDVGLLQPSSQDSNEHEKESHTVIHQNDEPTTWRNLPQKNQLLLLALCRLSTPLSNTCLLPYLYPLVASILTTPTYTPSRQDITQRTGLLVAAYPLGQMATSMLWGTLSDTYGRKPVILIGLLISVIANLAFGFSSSIEMLLVWRVVAGMSDGIVGVMRTMTTEIVGDKKWNARAFLAMPVVFNTGRVVALVLGGCLADPVRNMAWAFGREGVFNFREGKEGVEWAVRFPYALPALFNAVVLAACLGAAMIGLKESLEGKKARLDWGIELGRRILAFVKEKVLRRERKGYTAVRKEEDDINTSITAISPRSNFSTTKLPFRKIWTKSLIIALVSFGLLPLHNTAFLHIFPVFLSMPIQEDTHPTVFYSTSGLGFSPPTVGLSLATFGICGILLQLFLYPRLQTQFGTLGVFRLANGIFPLAYAFAPFLSVLAGRTAARWPAIGAILFLQVMARTMAIPSSIILLTEATPHRSVMGMVHGAGNTLSAFASAVGPAIGGVLLAKGIDVGFFGLVWWCWMLVIALVSLAWSFVVKSEDQGREEGL